MDWQRHISNVPTGEPRSFGGNRMAAKAIPEGYRSVTPYLIVEGAGKLLDFLPAGIRRAGDRAHGGSGRTHAMGITGRFNVSEGRIGVAPDGRQNRCSPTA